METTTIVVLIIALSVAVVIIMVGISINKKVESTDISDVGRGIADGIADEAKDAAKKVALTAGVDNPENWENTEHTGCAIWGEIERANLNGNSYCKNSFGDDYVMDRATRGPCLPGFGIAICKRDSVRSRYWNNPIADSHGVWNDDSLRNQWCANDIGPGSRFIAQERAGSFPGFSKGRCSIP